MTREDLGELIIASQETMYRVAKSMLRSDADCEDAMHNAIVKAFENLYALRNDSYAKTWLIRILINEWRLIIRSQSKVLPQESIETSYESDEDNSNLYEAIMKLEIKDRLVVVLYYFEDYRIRDIAKSLSMTENAVRNRLLRARKKLKELLEEGE